MPLLDTYAILISFKDAYTHIKHHNNYIQLYREQSTVHEFNKTAKSNCTQYKMVEQTIIFLTVALQLFTVTSELRLNTGQSNVHGISSVEKLQTSFKDIYSAVHTQLDLRSTILSNPSTIRIIFNRVPLVRYFCKVNPSTSYYDRKQNPSTR